MASNISMPVEIYQIIRDTIESALGKLCDLDVEKVCYSIVQNVQDIKVLMERVATLGRSLDNLYDELRQHKDTVARRQNQQANENVSRAPLVPPSSEVDDDNQSVSSVSSDAELSKEDIKEMKKIIREKKFEREGYFRRTILVRNLIKQNDDIQNLSFYRQCAKSLREHDLEILLFECDKFYVLNSGSVRFTFETRSKAICFLIEARRCAQSKRSRIQFDIMVPPESLDLKKRIQDFGRRLKSQRLVQSYQAFESRASGSWKFNLRIFIHGYGQYRFKNSEIGEFEDLKERTKALIDSFGVVGIAEIERMQAEE